MSNLSLPIILQVVGILVIVIEVIVPTGGILAILSMGLIGGSLYLVFSKATLVTGYIFIVADLIVIPMSIFLGFKLLAKSPAALKRSLLKEEGVQSQSPELEMYLGMEGFAATDLRPSGVAFIDGKRLDVVSRGEYLEKASNIVVIAVTGNQIIVSKKE